MSTVPWTKKELNEGTKWKHGELIVEIAAPLDELKKDGWEVVPSGMYSQNCRVSKKDGLLVVKLRKMSAKAQLKAVGKELADG